MPPERKAPATIWREDSAIWEIIAGELVVQHTDAIAGDPAALMRRGREHALDAVQLLRAGDKDSAGHTLIGCALALGLADRLQSGGKSPIESSASEFAAAISWQATEPTVEDIEELRAVLERSTDPHASETPTLWELAIRVGAYASGLSPYITRRRERRDLV